MKFSYNWLKEFCDFQISAHDLAENLSKIGFCVETYEPVGDDWVLDVEVTPNRSDCLSHVGLAREVAAVTGRTISYPAVDVPHSETRGCEDLASVSVTAPELCPHYTARVITGVRVGPSPGWMQHRLNTCGIRPINNVVDVTNYVMLESGQPLHAFDLARLAGRTVIVRRARNGERMTAIDGTPCELSEEMCVIADATKPVAVAGVMGGLESEIGESTAEVLLESARFDPVSIRRASRRLGLASESSYRFERSVDPGGPERASRRACQLIVELAGGELAGGLFEYRFDARPRRDVSLRLSRLRLLLGIEVPVGEVRRIFEGLELEIVKQTDERITVTVPSWRRDLEREIDLIEEVARILGYDRIQETTEIPVRPVVLSRLERFTRSTRRLLAGEGFFEVMTGSLVTASALQAAQPWSEAPPLELRNPVSSQKTHLRLTNMPGLLAVKSFNAAHGTPQVNLFELGKVYLPRASGTDPLPEEKTCLSLLSDDPHGFLLLKGTLENLLEASHAKGGLEELPGSRGPFEPSESLTLKLDGALLGCLGRASKEAAEQFDLENRPAMMEIDFELLAARCRFDAPYCTVPQYPASRRDLAVVVSEEVRWADLKRCILQSAPAFLESVEFFDVYRGKQVPPGRKSVAFSLTFRSPQRTLTREEVDSAQDQCLDALKKELGATLRT